MSPAPRTSTTTALAGDARVRLRVDADRGERGLGALPLRPLDVDHALGMDLGGRCALGLCAVSLRPLGPVEQQLVLGAGPAARCAPVYAPALVAWVGGPTAGAPVAFGSNVGWFPLGPTRGVRAALPREPAATCATSTSATPRLVSNTYITNIYQNRPCRRRTTPTIACDAVTSRAAEHLHLRTAGRRARGAPGTGAAHRRAGHGRSARRAAHPPERARARARAAASSSAGRTAAAERRGAHRPPPRAPVPFDDQLAAIQANGGRPLARGELARLQPATADASVRAVAIAGPVVHAGAAQPAVAGGRAAAAPPPAASAASTFAERERILQHPQIPAPPDASSARPRANAFVPPELPRRGPVCAGAGQRAARAASGRTHRSAARLQRRRCDACARSAAATLPVYAPPVTPDVGQPENEPHASAPTYRAPAATPRAAAPATQRLPPPPPAQPPASSARGARDSAAAWGSGVAGEGGAVRITGA